MNKNRCKKCGCFIGKHPHNCEKIWNKTSTTKIKLFKIGRLIPPMKDKYHTKQTKLKISNKKKGIKVLEETKKKISKTLKGRKNTWGNEISKSLKEYYKTHKNWNDGKKRPKHSKKMSKEGNPSWLGGKSFEPYGLNWTDTLKEAIRQRDWYMCQLCGKTQGKKALQVHHIDYNKRDCNPENLVTLCNSCHMKTSFNREKWKFYFQNKEAIEYNKIMVVK